MYQPYRSLIFPFSVLSPRGCLQDMLSRGPSDRLLFAYLQPCSWMSGRAYVCVCVCVCLSSPSHAVIHAQKWMQSWIRSHVTDMCIYIDTDTHTQTHVDTRTSTYAHTHPSTYTNISAYKGICNHTLMQTQSHTLRRTDMHKAERMYKIKQVYTYICMYAQR